MIRKTESVTAPAQAVAPITALPPELLVAVDAVNQRVRDCDRLDQAINEVPAARDQLDREQSNLSGKLATAEAALALCDRGSDDEVKHLASVEKLTLSLASVERERKRIDARELALEAQGTPLDEKLAQAVTELRLEVSYFTATLREAIAAEFRTVLPAVLVARAKLQALVPLGDHRVFDALYDSRLIDPASDHQHFAVQGDQQPLRGGVDLLAESHPDADAAGAALTNLLQPVVKALGASRRAPFKTLRERRQQTYEGKRGFTISTWRPDAVPAAPPKPPVSSLEAQSRSYQPRSDSSGARTRGATTDMNFGAQFTANLMRDE